MFIYSLIFFKKLKMNLESKKYKNRENEKVSLVQMISLSLFLSQDNLSHYSNELGLTQSLFSHSIKKLIKWIKIKTKKNAMEILENDYIELNIIKKRIKNKFIMISQLLKELDVLAKNEKIQNNKDLIIRLRKVLNIRNIADIDLEKWEEFRNDVKLLTYIDEKNINNKQKENIENFHNSNILMEIIQKSPIIIEEESWEKFKNYITMLIAKYNGFNIENMSINTINTIIDFHDEPIVKNIIWKNNRFHIPKNINKLLFVLYELVEKYNCEKSEYSSEKLVTNSALNNNLRKIKEIIWWEIFEQVNWKINLTTKWRKIYEYSMIYIETINELENEVNKMIKFIESKIK